MSTSLKTPKIGRPFSTDLDAEQAIKELQTAAKILGRSPYGSEANRHEAGLQHSGIYKRKLGKTWNDVLRVAGLKPRDYKIDLVQRGKDRLNTMSPERRREIAMMGGTAAAANKKAKKEAKPEPKLRTSILTNEEMRTVLIQSLNDPQVLWKPRHVKRLRAALLNRQITREELIMWMDLSIENEAPF